MKEDYQLSPEPWWGCNDAFLRQGQLHVLLVIHSNLTICKHTKYVAVCHAPSAA
jgi:hypothetical protein